MLVSLRAYAALSPYFARWAQYGLLTPGLHFVHPGLCSGALSGRSHTAPNLSHLPPADVHSPTPNLSHLPPADVHSPSHIIYARSAGVNSPSPNHLRPLRGRQFPLAIYGEGVADRPGVRSNRPGGEVKQAEGEVKQAGSEVCGVVRKKCAFYCALMAFSLKLPRLFLLYSQKEEGKR